VRVVGASGLQSAGSSAEEHAAVAAKVHLIASLPLLDELQAVLFRKKFAGQFAAQE
jgi:hypothetical protein